MAHVLHEGSKSTHDEPETKVYHHARSRILFFQRHTHGAQRPLFVISELAFIARNVGSHLLTGRMRNARAYVRGTIDGLREGRSRTGQIVRSRPAVSPADDASER